MKALIMAAGKGTRISRYIEGKPKCMVDIGETTLIEYTINELLKRGVTDISLVLGYQWEVLKDLLERYPITYYYNPFYDVTNSIASAWFAKECLTEDMILMNADVYLEETLLHNLLLDDNSPVLFSDSSRKEEADYKLYYKDNQLIKFGKELQGEEISGEYVGVAKIKKSFLPFFKTRLEKLIQKNQHHMWWEDVLYSYVNEEAIYIRDIKGKFWAEVDFIEDYERILEFRNYKIFNNSVVNKEV